MNRSPKLVTQRRSGDGRIQGWPWQASPLRSGFTLIEIIVALAIMVMMATVITPSVLGVLDAQRVEKTAASFENFANAIDSFYQDVNEHPGTLSQLAEPISRRMRNSCGDRYSFGEVYKWSGPYINRIIPETGLPTGIGTADNTLVREPPDVSFWSGADGYLIIVVREVTEEDAKALNDKVDGDNDRQSGTVQWDPPDPDGFVVLNYLVPVHGC